MSTTSAYNEVLNQVLDQVQQLSTEDQLQLVEDLIANIRQQVKPRPKHSILELEGLGAEVWKGINVEEYINQERDSWDG